MKKKAHLIIFNDTPSEIMRLLDFGYDIVDEEGPIADLSSYTSYHASKDGELDNLIKAVRKAQDMDFLPVIITDLHLPKVTGEKAIKLIREGALEQVGLHGREIPIIIYSGRPAAALSVAEEEFKLDLRKLDKDMFAHNIQAIIDAWELLDLSVRERRMEYMTFLHNDDVKPCFMIPYRSWIEDYVSQEGNAAPQKGYLPIPKSTDETRFLEANIDEEKLTQGSHDIYPDDSYVRALQLRNTKRVHEEMLRQVQNLE